LFTRSIIAFFVFLSLMFFAANFAAEAIGRTSAERVQIVEDQQAGAVRILIDGRPVVVINESGLRVTGDVDYTGVIQDTGSAGVSPSEAP
jgi:hypothetical protein